MNTSSEKPIHKIQATIFRSQMFLIVILTVLVTIMGLGLNLYYESRRLDENLQNVAETIASSQIIQNEVRDSNYSVNNSVMKNYLDSLKKSLSNIDVISVVRHDGIRRYHSSPDLIGTVYDGTIPEFIHGQREFYASDDKGPSGFQRRAYAAIYGDDGEYIGFVMAVMLRQNILKNNIQMVFLYLCAAGIAIGFAVLTSVQLSGRIKQQLMGYEPDAFTAMFKIRDDILGSLEEGVLAIDSEGRVMFLNEAASQMLHLDSQESAGKLLSEVYPDTSLNRILHTGEKEFNVRLKSRKDEDILSNRIPLIEDGQTVGAVSIFRNRTEYTKLMEDLTGVRYMVESMRANNHDFTNKLHVILGLIQMGNYEEAEKYIVNITMVERETIHHIMQVIDDPSIAALLIGKNARASELNIRYTIKKGSNFTSASCFVPSGVLITIIGNLIDNAMDAMNRKDVQIRELTVGIFTDHQGTVITVDDSGCGISEQNLEHIFENGYSTKGTGRGVGLYQIKKQIESYNGTIFVESETGIGTSFTVSFRDSE